MAGEVSPVGQGLRAVATGVGWVALSGLCNTDAASSDPDIGYRWEFTTRSNLVVKPTHLRQTAYFQR